MFEFVFAQSIVFDVLFLFLNQQYGEEERLTCHQCKRNDKGRVVRCSRCNKKRFCLFCLRAWYNFAFLCFSPFLVMFTILLHGRVGYCFLLLGEKS